MVAWTWHFYIPPWVIISFIFAGISAYLFVLSAHLDRQDPTDQDSSKWAKINYGVAGAVAALIPITIVWGIFHQRKLKSMGWKGGLSPEAQADALAGQAARFNKANPGYGNNTPAPVTIQMVAPAAPAPTPAPPSQ